MAAEGEKTRSDCQKLHGHWRGLKSAQERMHIAGARVGARVGAKVAALMQMQAECVPVACASIDEQCSSARQGARDVPAASEGQRRCCS